MHERRTLQHFPGVLIELALSIVVGAVAGLGAVGFRLLIDQVHDIFFDRGASLLAFMGHYYIILLPAIGGLLLGPLIHFLAREARGNGVPQVMEAVSLRGGRIRPIVSLVKVVSASLCIGSGGSAGREGPIVQIGSSLGSSIGQIFRLSDDSLKTLVACGAAGGIAATFNAPLAGAIFALEIVLRRVVTPIFAYVFLAAITANYVASFFLPTGPIFAIPSFQFVSPVEIGLYALLGVIGALAAIALMRAMFGLEDIFKAIEMPEYLKPAVGGLGVGLIGVYEAGVLGLGYGEIQQVLTGNLALWFLVLMAVLKIAATSLTLGSGGSGGIFSPSLFVGAMLGAAFSRGLQSALPGDIGDPGAYAIVGMAAVFGAAARAPFTAVIVVIEMTRDYSLVLPLMASVSLAVAIVSVVSRGTIYTTSLMRRGVDIEKMDHAGN